MRGNRICTQKTDQETEATLSQNLDDVMRETEEKQEKTKEGLFESILSKENLGNEKELDDIRLSEEEMDEPKKVELAEYSETTSKNISLGTLNSATWTNECQLTEVDPTGEEKGEDIELAGSTNVDVIQPSDLDFGEESEVTEVVAEPEWDEAN